MELILALEYYYRFWLKDFFHFMSKLDITSTEIFVSFLWEKWRTRDIERYKATKILILFSYRAPLSYWEFTNSRTYKIWSTRCLLDVEQLKTLVSSIYWYEKISRAREGTTSNDCVLCLVLFSLEALWVCGVHFLMAVESQFDRCKFYRGILLTNYEVEMCIYDQM